MKASLKWLRDYVDITLPPREIGRRLTMAGLEVTGIETVGDTWDRVVVGEVTDVKPHPNADRLTLVTVGIGTEQMTVVCGAPNVRIGQRVPFARVGARLRDGHTAELVSLKPARIRGIVSEGMVCSEKELGMSDNHERILVLPESAPIGATLGSYLGDAVLDIDVTPNRADCLSLIGIAREIATLTAQPLRLPRIQIQYDDSEEPIDSYVSVDIAEPELCPRYCAALILGVRVASSPVWLQRRLSSYGMRPVNNVVDVTNYVMLEYGQPLHAFDYHKIKGQHVIVRRARKDETTNTLDGTERRLGSDLLVIADKEGTIAIAGIMGCAHSEVTGNTRAVLIESANFSQVAIRRGCAKLQLQSEASIRFDKGLNRELPLPPLRKAIQLLLEVAGGRAAEGLIDAYPGKAPLEPVSFDVEDVKRLSGLDVGRSEMTSVLESLGFECRSAGSGSKMSVVAPYWRNDIKCAADLVEEIVRIIGYERIPVARLSSPLPEQRSQASPAVRRGNLRRELRDVLTGFGFQEILSYSLVSLAKLEKLSPGLELDANPLRVANPMTKEQEYLRTSLRPGLLTTLARNQRPEAGGICLFEIGKVFLPQDEDLPEEREMLCALLNGPREELSWLSDREPTGFFDAKGLVENVLNRWRLRACFRPTADGSVLAGGGADVVIDDDNIGIVGELHPKVARAFELSGHTYLVELDLEKLLARVAGTAKYRQIPRFPAVTRDIALVVDDDITYESVENIVRSSPLVTQVTLFDLYRGGQIPEGRKSFAIRIVYQSDSRTLTDEEVDRTQGQTLERLHRELGAALRW
jgi:phenylalanyl-tRNA synthetase beta chain